ncbi:MAG: hypothetical protein WB555_07565 [Candidatus Korobacteraceae bacterium]
MTNASAWFALAGALGGVALAGVMGLVTAVLTHRWTEQARVDAYRKEQMRAIRDQRREVAHNFLVATNLFWQALDQLHQKACRGEEIDSFEHLRAANTALRDAYVDLTITCGARVRNIADVYHRKLYDLRPAAQAADNDNWSDLNEKRRQARRDLREAMRVELDVLDLYVGTGPQKKRDDIEINLPSTKSASVRPRPDELSLRPATIICGG